MAEMRRVGGSATTVTFPLLNPATGQTESGLAPFDGNDTQISLNGAAFTDSTNRPSESGSTGRYNLVLTAEEIPIDSVIFIKIDDQSGTKLWLDQTIYVNTKILGVTAAEFWNFSPRTLTITAEQISAVLVGTKVTLHRGDNLSLTITGLGDISNFTKLWFTVKPARKEVVDLASQIQVLQSVGTVDGEGLLAIAGNAPSSSDNGSITVDDLVSGDITITVTALEMAKLSASSTLRYDVQVLRSTGSVDTLTAGLCEIISDVTNTVV